MPTLPLRGPPDDPERVSFGRRLWRPERRGRQPSGHPRPRMLRGRRRTGTCRRSSPRGPAASNGFWYRVSSPGAAGQESRESRKPARDSSHTGPDRPDMLGRIVRGRGVLRGQRDAGDRAVGRFAGQVPAYTGRSASCDRSATNHTAITHMRRLLSRICPMPPPALGAPSRPPPPRPRPPRPSPRPSRSSPLLRPRTSPPVA